LRTGRAEKTLEKILEEDLGPEWELKLELEWELILELE
jgi:hypothetical protein